MPRVERLDLPLAGVRLVDASSGDPVDLGGLRGVHLVVLMRHRH